MGGIVIETVRDGVQFVPDAAAAFRRADAQVWAEFGRGVDVNSTYRLWSDQMKMFEDWNAYVGGWGPYPGHSKAVHPSESFHVSGLALDSDDWRIDRIVQILAHNGFIRNRLYVPGEQHHFEYIRSEDRNYGSPAGLGEEDDMFTDEDRKRLNATYAGVFGARNLNDKATPVAWKNIDGSIQKVNYGALPIVIHNQTLIAKLSGQVSAINEVVEQLAKANGAVLDLAAIEKAAERGAENAVRGFLGNDPDATHVSDDEAAA